MHRRFTAAALGLVLLAAPAAAFAQEPRPPAGPWAASWDYLAQQPPGSQSILVHALGGQPQLPAALAEMFTPAAACAFLAFTLLYTPCVAAIAAVRRELSGRHAAIVVCYQTLVAWLVGFVVYQLCGLFL